MTENKCVEAFRDSDEHEGASRQRWMSNATFVLAAIGSAIGLGNFWRFPYLCYKWGGGLFFVPYLGSLFLLGIPMMILEFGLGQLFQRGDIGVFRNIHPRLAGVGAASVLSAYCITLYYNVIIAWALVYLACSFVYPLPWSLSYTDYGKNGNKSMVRVRPEPGCPNMAITEEYFYRDILHVYNDDAECSVFDTKTVMAQGSTAQWQVMIASCIVWFCVFWCVFKGVKSSSYVVWITVPMPTIFIFIMVLNGLTLPNADQGIRMYLKGEQMKITFDAQGNYNNTYTDAIGRTNPGTISYPDPWDKLSNPEMWSDACGQIFFSIGVCMGIMTSYSSYNPVSQPIISNALRVSIGNCCFSFFCGFAVFSTVGYLNGLGSVVASKVSSSGLAFVAFPTSIDTLPMPNFWIFILALTLYTLGLDSAFSMVEAAATVITDTPTGAKIPRKLIALVLCSAGAVFSFLFCFNWGTTYFDVVDHYLGVYLLLLLGVFQSFGATWVFDFGRASEAHNKVCVLSLGIAFWGSLIPLAFISVFAFPKYGLYAMIAFWVIQIIAFIVSFVTAKTSCGVWYREVWLYGAYRLGCAISLPSCTNGKKACWVEPFIFWWGFCIKYFFPFGVTWLLASATAVDVSKPYGGYYWGW